MQEPGHRVKEFLGHSDRCEQHDKGLLDDDWDERLDVGVHTHLLNLWLREDCPNRAAIFSQLRPREQGIGLNPDALLRNGFFPVGGFHPDFRRPQGVAWGRFGVIGLAVGCAGGSRSFAVGVLAMASGGGGREFVGLT